MKLYLGKVSNWLAYNRLSLNIDKTVCMTFGNYADSVPEKFEVCLNNKVVKRVQYAKYRGVQIDYRLRWEEDIKTIVRKTN